MKKDVKREMILITIMLNNNNANNIIVNNMDSNCYKKL